MTFKGTNNLQLIKYCKTNIKKQLDKVEVSGFDRQINYLKGLNMFVRAQTPPWGQ